MGGHTYSLHQYDRGAYGDIFLFGYLSDSGIAQMFDVEENGIRVKPEGATKAQFYVSLDGSDDWSGTLAAPNPEKTDGPFRSLERARDAVRERMKSKTAEDVLVLIRGGRYELSKTVVFGLEDSGTLPQDGSIIMVEVYLTNEASLDDPLATMGEIGYNTLAMQAWPSAPTPPVS